MANVPVCAPGPSPAQGNVYLLAVDSISDLYMETPQGEEVLADAHGEISISAPPCKPEAPAAEVPAAGRRCGSPCTTTLLTILIVIALVNMSLLLYVLQLYRDQDGFLRSLAEKFGAQTDYKEAGVTVSLGLRALLGRSRDTDM